MNPLSIVLPLNIFGIGFEENQPHISRKEGFPVHQIFLCTEGRGEILLRNEHVQVEKGDFFFVPAFLPHEYSGLTGKWVLEWCAFYADSKMLESTGFSDFRYGKLSTWEPIDSIYKKIFSTLKNETESSKVSASASLYELLAEIYKGQEKEKEISLTEKKVLDAAINYIHENFCLYFTIDELSEQAGVSPQYLCRLFQKHLQMRPYQYVAKKRIQKAKEMLKKRSTPISEIAKAIGYNDFSYFCSVFKKHEGISPSEFRG